MSKFALAYGMKKRKKMAEGGGADSSPSPSPDSVGDEQKRQDISDSFKSSNSSAWDNLKHAAGYAKGGMIEGEEKKSGYMSMPGDDVKSNEMAKHESHKDLNQKKVMAQNSMEGDMVDRIMKKHNPNLSGLDRYSEGGKVANDVGAGMSADKMPNQSDDLVLDDDLESSFDGSNAGDFKDNDQENKDRADIVARIMSSRKKKDKLPNPA